MLIVFEQGVGLGVFIQPLFLPSPLFTFSPAPLLSSPLPPHNQTWKVVSSAVVAWGRPSDPCPCLSIHVCVTLLSMCISRLIIDLSPDYITVVQWILQKMESCCPSPSSLHHTRWQHAAMCKQHVTVRFSKTTVQQFSKFLRANHAQYSNCKSCSMICWSGKNLETAAHSTSRIVDLKNSCLYSCESKFHSTLGQQG